MAKVRLLRSIGSMELHALFPVGEGDRMQRAKVQLKDSYEKLDRPVVFATRFDPDREITGYLTFRTVDNNTMVGMGGLRIVSIEDPGFYVPFADIVRIDIGEGFLLGDDEFTNSFLFEGETHAETPCQLPYFHLKAVLEYVHSDKERFRHFHHRRMVICDKQTNRMHAIQLSNSITKEVYWKNEGRLQEDYETDHVIIYDIEPVAPPNELAKFPSRCFVTDL